MATSYLLTGATGVVGSAVLEQLLADPETTVHLLVRGDSDAQVAARTRALTAYLGIGPDDHRSRLVAHRGDVARPHLGVCADGMRRLEREVTRVIHSAGDVHMGRTIACARSSAVGGAREILALSDRLHRAGRLEKLEFVSTVGVGGRGASTLAETFIERPMQFHNTYEQAKWEAEELVQEAVAKGLPATVHRPSMVVGDERTGRSIRPQIFATICRFLSGSATFGLLPEMRGEVVDLVPQSFVAQALIASSRARETVGRVLHLCSGAAESILVQELASVAQRSVRRLGAWLPDIRRVNAKLYRRAVRALGAVAPRDMERRVRVFDMLLDYLQDLRPFANEATLELLAGRGVTLPPSRTYLEAVVAQALSPTAAAQRVTS